uniref:Coat protein n=1 Tax=Black grass cryptic virus 1 TaxID=1587516 RepID=A0A0D6DTU5_9VIRU|nr:coat protein [Black grass cryptic virus 1]
MNPSDSHDATNSENHERAPAPPATAAANTHGPNPNAGTHAPAPQRPASRPRVLQAPPHREAHNPVTSAPALLELASNTTMYTKSRDGPSLFVPDAQFMFYILGLCDLMMNATEQFTGSAPAWLPIVSQAYVSVLWITMILKVQVGSGHAPQFRQIEKDLIKHLRLDECMIPGPLVPFFQALAAINGPFAWSGDILPAMPQFSVLWDPTRFCNTDNFVRQLPVPATILDQLYAFATWTPANHVAGTSTYTTFQWYRNIFSVGSTTRDIRTLMGPQHCGSIYSSPGQFDTAQDFWQQFFVTGFTRTNAAANPAVPFTNLYQYLGLQSQSGAPQFHWFQPAAEIMDLYSRFFVGSKPLKAILTSGLGACAIYAAPNNSAAVRSWLYPAATAIGPFHATVPRALRDIPDTLSLCFNHSDHKLEPIAEQYAMLTNINILWATITTANNWTGIDDTITHAGPYWTSFPHRHSASTRLKNNYQQVIASKYHRYSPI